MPPYQTGKASIECGLDENLEKGASYYQTGKYLGNLRVILEDFAARPHSSGANVQKQGKQSSKTRRKPRISRK
jgi:hypothetical protein